jgi:hypothetical protein
MAYLSGPAAPAGIGGKWSVCEGTLDPQGTGDEIPWSEDDGNCRKSASVDNSFLFLQH